MRFLEKNKLFVIAVAIILLIIIGVFTFDRNKPTFIENGIGFALTGMQSATHAVSGWFGSRIDFVTNLDGIENENATLKKDVVTMELELSRLKRVEDENKKLLRLLEIDSKYAEHKKVGADIIAKDYGCWYDNFIINKGTKDGLDKNMVVLADGGLVGRIVESGYNYSKVITMIDDVDAISAKSVRTDDIGFVRGDIINKGICKMEYIDTEAEIVEGDEIVTSHLSQIYPPGITLGYVKEIHTDTNTLTKYAVIEPTVDFKHLDTVLVITQKFKTEYKNAEE